MMKTLSGNASGRWFSRRYEDDGIRVPRDGVALVIDRPSVTSVLTNNGEMCYLSHKHTLRRVLSAGKSWIRDGRVYVGVN